MKGSKILGKVCAALSGVALAGVIGGADHQLFIAVILFGLSLTLLSQKIYNS